MSDSQPLPSVECPEHYVQPQHESTASTIVPQVQGAAVGPYSARAQTPDFNPWTEENQLLEYKDNALIGREQLRNIVRKADIDHDLGGELNESSGDPRYWVERGHYFEAETYRLTFALRAAEEGGQCSGRTDSDDCLRDPIDEAQKEWAIQSWAEFHLEANKVGLKLLEPSELDHSSHHGSYWRKMGIFYFHETQKVSGLDHKAKPDRQESWRPPTPPRVLSQAEEELMAYHKDTTLKYREELYYWVRKADLELVNPGDLDESSRDPEYWAEMAGFYCKEAVRVKMKYQLYSSKDTGYIIIGTNPETGERYIKERKMYDNDEVKAQTTHNTDQKSEPKKAAQSPHVTKPRLPRKTKQSKNKASRADPASRGAVSKRSRAVSPIASRLRSKARPLQQAKQVHK